MIFFTADTHFGHANIIRLCDRPFGNIGAMNESLISAWNDRVSGNDTVYVVGDMFFRYIGSSTRSEIEYAEATGKPLSLSTEFAHLRSPLVSEIMKSKEGSRNETKSQGRC